MCNSVGVLCCVLHLDVVVAMRNVTSNLLIPGSIKLDINLLS